MLQLDLQYSGEFGPPLTEETHADGTRLRSVWKPCEGGSERRAREAHWGSLLQVDGSYHVWFESRGLSYVVMAYIEEATSQVSVRSHEYEGTASAMDSFRRYVLRA